GLIESPERTAAVPGAQRHRFPPPKTLFFAITRDSIQTHDANLSPNDLRPSQLNNVVERHFLDPAIRRMLYDRLIAPVAEILAGKTCVSRAPHGPLHYIPFQALLALDGRPLLRDDGPRLSYAPSAPLLLRLVSQVPNYAQGPCLALGFNGTGANRLFFAED